jgi:isochorismate hydrolase
MMGKWWHDSIVEDSPLSQITGELDSSSGILIKKSQYDAFYQTDLANLLHARAIKQVLICRRDDPPVLRDNRSIRLCAWLRGIFHH